MKKEKKDTRIYIETGTYERLQKFCKDNSYITKEVASRVIDNWIYSQASALAKARKYMKTVEQAEDELALWLENRKRQKNDK